MKTKEQLANLAKEFGVPLPDTSKKLEWKSETSFYWKEGFGLFSKSEIEFLESGLHLGIFYAAPTMQDIFKAMFKYSKGLVITVMDNYIDLGIGTDESPVTFTWEDENLAECAAQLYLELIEYTS